VALGLTDEQAARRTTASELTLGGLIKHVTAMERQWIRFIRIGPETIAGSDESWASNFHMTDDDTLAGLLNVYEEVARDTDAFVATVDLDDSQPLPEAPWFAPGARWSARRALLHLIAETSQHAGHADIIRESLDGAKTMG
jgi:uncharacterized damage-inducible protein DinB